MSAHVGDGPFGTEERVESDVWLRTYHRDRTSFAVYRVQLLTTEDGGGTEGDRWFWLSVRVGTWLSPHKAVAIAVHEWHRHMAVSDPNLVHRMHIVDVKVDEEQRLDRRDFVDVDQVPNDTIIDLWED